MAYRLAVNVDIQWVPDGTGLVTMGQDQSNNPGYGGLQVPGSVGNAQTFRINDAEAVPGGDTPTAGNFSTAFTNLAASLVTQMSTVGVGASGNTTPLAIVQGWSTGNP